MSKGIEITKKILKTLINEKEAASLDTPASIARKALQSVIILQMAFNKACEDAADDCCPQEYGLYECELCEECPHQGELHVDTQRDIECWKNYYLQEAEKEQRSEGDERD